MGWYCLKWPKFIRGAKNSLPELIICCRKEYRRCMSEVPKYLRFLPFVHVTTIFIAAAKVRLTANVVLGTNFGLFYKHPPINSLGQLILFSVCDVIGFEYQCIWLAWPVHTKQLAVVVPLLCSSCRRPLREKRPSYPWWRMTRLSLSLPKLSPSHVCFEV